MKPSNTRPPLAAGAAGSTPRPWRFESYGDHEEWGDVFAADGTYLLACSDGVAKHIVAAVNAYTAPAAGDGARKAAKEILEIVNTLLPGQDIFSSSHIQSWASIIDRHCPATAGGGEALKERARQIIADEERLSAADDKNDTRLYSMRLLRVYTAQQILGEKPLTTNPHPDSGGKI